MTQFSSKLPFNDDPLPRMRRHPELGYMGRFESRFPNDTHSDYQMKHSPRPEYDRPQHNPTNPILTKLRSLKEAHRPSWVDGFLDQATHVRFPNWTDSETDHAIKVLLKWKAVFG